MSGETQLFSARAVRWIDIGVVVWVVAWVALGVLVWHDIRAQTQLSGDVIKVGTAVKDTGQALGVVGGLPLIGGSIGDFAAKIEKMGAEVAASGEDSGAGIKRIAVVAGLGVGILPAAMILFLYLPVRVRWRRYVRAVAKARMAPDRRGLQPRNAPGVSAGRPGGGAGRHLCGLDHAQRSGFAHGRHPVAADQWLLGHGARNLDAAVLQLTWLRPDLQRLLWRPAGPGRPLAAQRQSDHGYHRGSGAW